MRNALFAGCLIVAGSLWAMSSVAHAEAVAQRMPMESRVVVYAYEPHNTYTVLARPGAMTTITFGEDEELTGFALGDTIRWKAEEAGRHIFVKPMVSGLFTTAALVTNKRTYLLNLRSSPEDGIWYQSVVWEYPHLMMMKRVEQKKKEEAAKKEEERQESMRLGALDDPTKLNFSYKIEGDERVKPQQVFDDGKFTWIRLASGDKEMPVVMMDNDGKLELMNYVVKGDFIIVQQTFDKAVLRVGSRAAEITRSGSRRGFLGLFGQ